MYFDAPALVTVSEAAQILHCDRQTIIRNSTGDHAGNGGFPVARRIGGRWFLLRDDVLALVGPAA